MTRQASVSGVTLTELMIAVALIGIGVLGAIGAFNGIQKSIQYSKARTLAANLCQEKMQIVMQKSYYAILVTTAPAYRTEFTPNIPYDPSYFPPETILEGSIWFTRLTYVQVVQENSGVIQVLPPTTPDTGMRQITVTVIWQQGPDNRSHGMRSIINNPNTVMANSVINGKVTDSVTISAIASALVNAAENVGWRSNTDSQGNYSINLVPGTFNFVASAQGYFSKSIAVTTPPNGTVTQNFSLTPISSGTIRGNAWLNTHVVISQVVASTGTSNDIEYVELYNPTTYTIFIGSNNVVNSPNYWPILWDWNNTQNQRHLFYINSYIPSNGYYLITNTGNADPATTCSTITLSGSIINPDACWLHVFRPSHAIECNVSPCPLNGTNPGLPNAGGVSLANSQGYVAFTWPATRVDSVAWSKTNVPSQGAPSNAVEGTGYSLTAGIQAGEQLYRMSAPGTYQPGKGSAYDEDNNSADFLENALTWRPHNSGAIETAVAGTPAYGSIVSVNDGLSSASSATLTGNPPYAQFIIPGVATGTWSVLVGSGTLSATVNLVAVTSNTTTLITNAATSPPWPASGFYSTFLSSSGRVGMISGSVTNVAGGVISPSIVVNAGGVNTTAGPTGNYAIRIGTGTYNVTANPGNGNASYEAKTQAGVIVTLGNVTGNVNFVLAQGGQVSGWITADGVNPLPGVSMVALDSNGQARDTEVSGSNGNFLLINLTTGTYTIQPVLDPKQTSTPSTKLVTVAAGTTVSAGTFTVTGAMGKVTGSVTASGQPIKSGVLFVISTTTITTPPPALNAGALTGAAYYAGSSGEDGTYSVDVRGSTTTTYNVAAFYTRLNGQTPVISSQTVANVSVTPGQTTSKNFTW